MASAELPSCTPPLSWSFPSKKTAPHLEALPNHGCTSHIPQRSTIHQSKEGLIQAIPLDPVLPGSLHYVNRLICLVQPSSAFPASRILSPFTSYHSPRTDTSVRPCRKYLGTDSSLIFSGALSTASIVLEQQQKTQNQQRWRRTQSRVLCPHTSGPGTATRPSSPRGITARHDPTW